MRKMARVLSDQMRNVLICLGCFLLLFVGCQTIPDRGPVSKDGKTYGVTEGLFQNRWWHYYERALSYMEGEFFDNALADLDIAIGKRYADKRRARTYGLHFIDYFPHREKGVIYYLAGDFETALSELEISISAEPTAKALYYRDKIRKLNFDQNQTLSSAPSIRIQGSAELWTKDDPVVIEGQVTDERFVTKIQINERPVFLSASEKQVGFSEEFSLKDGHHTIRVIAQNLAGGSAKQQVMVHVDRQGPAISITAIGGNSEISKQVTGYLYDESGRMTLQADDRQIIVGQGKEAAFTVPVFATDTQVTLVASDRLGNTTRAIVELTGEGGRGEDGVEQALLADISDDVSWVAFGRKKNKDTYPPTIKLNGWTESQTVYMETVFIEGDIRDRDNITNVLVNGTPVLRRAGKNIFFNHLMRLNPGKNRIRVSAVDASGNRAEHQIEIIREVPEVFRLGSRFSFSLIPFESKGMQTGLNDMYDSQFLVKLMDQNRFNIIERAKLDLILKEQKLSASDLVNEDTALSLGKLAAAQATMVGSFIETRIGIEVVGRLIDNETAEIIAVKDVYDEFKDRAALKDMAEGMAVKFHREFPMLKGMILKVEGNNFYVDLGDRKVTPHTRFIVYKEGEAVRHPDTGIVLGKENTILGQARVTQVMEGMSKAEWVRQNSDETLAVKDKVVTQ